MGGAPDLCVTASCVHLLDVWTHWRIYDQSPARIVVVVVVDWLEYGRREGFIFGEINLAPHALPDHRFDGGLISRVGVVGGGKDYRSHEAQLLARA